MNAFDMILMAIPVITYTLVMISIKTGKLQGVYVFLVITSATMLLGWMSLSLITPIDPSAHTLRGFVLNTLVVLYALSFLYGGIGMRKNNYERAVVGGVSVAMISLVSAVV
ncbi:MAG: hypothetical protein FWD92_03605 [Methanomassiliicoccaceae archaeon]|nr:hypothetical protein [Methanomassiliicoccaceae archaeon]